MNSELLKSVMEQTGKTMIDVASATKMHPITIYRYLKGKNISRSLKASLERWVQDNSKELNNPS